MQPPRSPIATCPAGRPSGRQVQAQLGDEHRRSSTLKGVTIFLAYFLVYWLGLVGIIALPWWPARLLGAFLCGVVMTSLLTVGHDAGHHSLTPHPWLNRLLGRLALLPALHAFSVWRVAHLRGHHDFTNLRGKDHVWAPLARADYNQLSWIGRLLQRCYRTTLGVGLYYLVEIWIKNAFIRNRRVSLKGLNTWEFVGDWLLVAGFVGVQGWALCTGHRYLAAQLDLTPLSPVVVLVLGMVLPFLVFCWLIGFLTFQQHTHPKINWYADQKEWSFFGGAVQGTTHIVLPRPWALLFHHVMEHGAHHVDPRIPMYHLPQSQRQLEAAYPDLIVQDFSWAAFRRVLATCQLYDYEHHRWLDFAGNPTTPLQP
jgi:omega-6 fatty acid desaturase (delta-12 desaturase)